MAIAFLPPDIEQGPCAVTVGVVAGKIDIEPVAESFKGLVDVRLISDSCSTVGCEAVFRQSENPQEVEVLLPLRDDPSQVSRLLVSVAVSPFPALDSVAYAVLAPAFAPGGAGVDWDDVCLILRSGKRAVLAMVDTANAMTDLYSSVMSELMRLQAFQTTGVMPACFLPLGAGLDWTREVQYLGIFAEMVAPYALRLPSIPFILGGPPVYSMLMVFSE